MSNSWEKGSTRRWRKLRLRADENLAAAKVWQAEAEKAQAAEVIWRDQNGRMRDALAEETRARQHAVANLKRLRDGIEARIQRAKAEALREAATATLGMTYPTSADPDVWGAWLLERAEALGDDDPDRTTQPKEEGTP